MALYRWWNEQNKVLELTAQLEVIEIRQSDKTTEQRERQKKEVDLIKTQIEQLEMFLNK